MKKKNNLNLSLSKKTISNLTASNLMAGDNTWSNETGNPFCFLSTADNPLCETTSLSDSQGITCSWCPNGAGQNTCRKEIV
ncbi:hypothetical protein IMCC3317_44240 [Kordia antarctica]|uniref:Uncharacterized protein n=1 Tax=Kordia antarctica TaxID=1218801 RepID=A0A7L4ZU88_9FLAO|nr:hypothetical protein [Kordia antarctica]QHI39024.1 hypothetical protein IMCC3317_44240 [Kordia antarctica]